MGERPELSGGDFMNSRRVYHGAASYVVGKSVFDFGCGLGHGTLETSFTTTPLVFEFNITH